MKAAGNLLLLAKKLNLRLIFIEINKIKLSPLFELKVKSKINENEPLYDQEILAPLISVDLIENAFKHADIHSPEAFISITFGFSRQHVLSFRVE